MRPLKVYGWTALIREQERKLVYLDKNQAHRIQVRCVVAAVSMAEIGRLLNRRPGSLFNLTEIGNAREIAAALAQPRTFLVRGLDSYHDPFIVVPPEAVS